MRIVIGPEQKEMGKCVVINNAGQLTTLWGGDICVGIRTSKGFFVLLSDGTDITIEHEEKVMFSTDLKSVDIG